MRITKELKKEMEALEVGQVVEIEIKGRPAFIAREDDDAFAGWSIFEMNGRKYSVDFYKPDVQLVGNNLYIE